MSRREADCAVCFQIRRLRIEIEKLQWLHQQELSEMKHNLGEARGSRLPAPVVGGGACTGPWGACVWARTGPLSSSQPPWGDCLWRAACGRAGEEKGLLLSESGLKDAPHTQRRWLQLRSLMICFLGWGRPHLTGCPGTPPGPELGESVGAVPRVQSSPGEAESLFAAADTAGGSGVSGPPRHPCFLPVRADHG